MKVSSITSSNEESPGIEYRLIYNSCILLLNRKDRIALSIDTEQPIVNDKGEKVKEGSVCWYFNIFFIEDITKPKYDIESLIIPIPEGTPQEDVKSEANIFLTNWISPQWIETINPIYFESADKQQKIYIKIRTSAMDSSNFRDVNITIWQIVT